jgi:hypothetical protein
MSAPSADLPAASPGELLSLTRQVTARRRAASLMLWAMALLPVGVVALVGADGLCALPDAVRAAASALLVAAVLALACAGLWGRLRPPAVDAVLLAEAALQDHDRRLTVTMELALMGSPVAAAFFAPQVPTRQLERALPPLRWRMAAISAAGAVLCGSVLWLALPGIFRMTVPRLLDPWGDHPPWSRLHLTWQALPGVVAYDATPTLHLEVTGGDPADLEIHIKPDGAAESPVLSPFLLTRGVYAVTLAPVHQGLSLWASASTTRTTYQHIALDAIPHLIDCSLTVCAPAYARLPDETVRSSCESPSQLQLLSGSRLDISVHASRPLCALWWGDHLSVEAAMSRHALTSAGMSLSDPPAGEAWIMLEAPDGARSPPQLIARLERRIDQPPSVSIEMPEVDGLAVADAQIPLHIVASDDLGLVRLTRYRLVDNVQVDSQESPLGGTSDGYRGTIDLHGLHAGQVVRIGAVARDSCPGGGQLSPVAERVLRIISHEDYQKQLAATLDETALTATYGALLTQLAALQEQISARNPGPADASPSPAQAAARDSLNARLQALQDQLDALHQEKPIFAIEPDLQQELQRQIHEARQELEHPSAPQVAPSAQEAAAIQQQLQQLTDEARAVALREDLSDLAQEQRQLQLELQDLQADPHPGSDAAHARLRQAAREQQDIDRDLRQWREDAADLARSCEHRSGGGAQLSKDVHDLAKAVDDSQAPGLVAAAVRSAMVNQLPEAANHALQAAEALDQFRMSQQDQDEATSQGQCPGWCQGSRCGACRSQLTSMARRGHGHGRGVAGSGLGSGMMGLQAGVGGLQMTVPIYGPRPTSTRPGGRPGGHADGQGPAVDGDQEHPAQLEEATPYRRDLQHTTAGIGASFTPDEQHRIQTYYNGLDGDPLAPTPQEPAK